MIERYIFDIDGTLLFANWKKEDMLFKEKFGPDAFKLLKKKMPLLEEYEEKYQKYDIDVLSEHMSRGSGVNVSCEFIKEWIEYNGENLEDTINYGAVDILEHLKKTRKKLSVLTNWVSTTQIKRLERAGLLDYFDTVVCGDDALKPNKESFVLAAGDTRYDKCLMIGDNIEKDYFGAQAMGMQAYLVNQKNTLDKVKKLGGRR